MKQAAQYVELAKSTLRPAVNLFGTGGINMGGGDALQMLSLGASWEMDLWGRLRYSRNAYQATYASAQADFEFGRQSLAATMAKSWFTAGETALQIQLADEMIRYAQDLVTLAEKRQQVGLGNEQDIASARASLGSFEDTAKQVRLAHEQTLRALELLLGRYPAAELQARHDLPALPGPIPAGLPLEMLERRPDMIAAERRIAAAFNRVGEAKAARLPKLSLNANVSAISSDILALSGGLRAILRAASAQISCATLSGRCIAGASSDPHAGTEGGRRSIRANGICAPSATWKMRLPRAARWQNASNSCSASWPTTSACSSWCRPTIVWARAICVPCSSSS